MLILNLKLQVQMLLIFYTKTRNYRINKHIAIGNKALLGNLSAVCYKMFVKIALFSKESRTK